jgi:two-component system, LytTR family, response regulator
MPKVLLVENEKPIAERFSLLIQRLMPDFELLPVCDTVADAVLSIRMNNPDLVFMDVELNNNETGFDILKKVQPFNFSVIFATAYDKYAVQAIKFSALDYLLKPVTEEDLLEAVYRYKQERKAFNPRQFETLFENLGKATTMNQIALPTLNGLDFVAIDQIVYFEGEGSQTAVHLMDKAIPIILSKSLKECEEIMVSSGFYRIHKSYLINKNHLKKYIKGKDGQVLMSNNKTLEVSRTHKDGFLESLKS